MSEYRSFKKEWVPDGLVIMTRTARNGAATFALAYDDTFPQCFMADVPLFSVKRAAVEIGRLQRKAERAGTPISLPRAIRAERRQYAVAGQIDRLAHRTPETHLAELHERQADREFWRRMGVDGTADLNDDTLAKLRNLSTLEFD